MATEFPFLMELYLNGPVQDMAYARATVGAVRQSYSRTCGHCGQQEARPGLFKTCSMCRRQRYCGADCQKNDWEAHARVCKKKKLVKSSDPYYKA